MMGSPRTTSSKAILQRQFDGHDRAADSSASAVDQVLVPGEANASHGTRVDCAIAIGIDIAWRMGELQKFTRGARRTVELIQSSDAITDQVFVELAKLGHRE